MEEVQVVQTVDALVDEFMLIPCLETDRQKKWITDCHMREMRSLEDATLAVAAKVRAEQKHQQDIKLISDALLEEAVERDWCEDYDEFVKELNSKLNIKLKRLDRQYAVELSVKRTQEADITIYVNAFSPHEAEETAQEMFEENPNEYFDSGWFGTDAEVESCKVV